MLTSARRTLELTCGVSLQRWMVLWLSSIKVDGVPKYDVPQVNWLPVGIGGAVSYPRGAF